MTTYLPYPDFDKCGEVMHATDISMALKAAYEVLAYGSRPHCGLWRDGKYFAKTHLIRYAYILNKHWQVKTGIDRAKIKGVIRNIPVPVHEDNLWFKQICGLADKKMRGRTTVGLGCKISWPSELHESHQTALYLIRKNYYHTYFDRVDVLKPIMYGATKIDW